MKEPDAKAPETKAGRGRPQKAIDWEQFEKLCQIHCTLEEIASWFGCCEDTIEAAVKRHYKRNFSEVYKTYSAGGKISLRRAQWRAALNGNVTMLIWLGKQVLGQKDIVYEPDGDGDKDMSDIPVERLVSALQKCRSPRSG